MSKQVSASGLEYNTLRASLDDLGHAVIKQMQSLQIAVANRDPEQLRAIVARDREIDAKDLYLDKMVRSFVELRAPLGPDFRFAMAALDISGNLERIGDCIEYVARHIIENQKLCEDFPDAWTTITSMIAKCLQILEAAYRSWTDSNAALAREVREQDDFVDALQESAYSLVIKGVRSGKVDVELGMIVMLTANKLESIADISCHIAESVVMMLQAKQIRHEKITKGM